MTLLMIILILLVAAAVLGVGFALYFSRRND